MKKRFLIIIPVIALIIIGITYAWWDWTSTTNSASFTVSDLVVDYSGGPDISGIKLIPVTSKEKGEADGTAVVKTITASANGKIYMDLNMTLETYPNDLKDNTLVWEIYNGNQLVNSGNLGSVSQGDVVKIFSGQPITETTTTYKLYIWIDGRVDNPNRMQNQDFKFVLSANATNEKPQVIASDYIKSLSQGDTYTEGEGNGVYATNSYDDNGVTKYHEYRYVGGEVNNYVSFNNDLYRIIGVFDDNSHGVTGQNLVKLIAANELTSAGWGAYNSAPAYTTYFSYKNDWTGNTTGAPASANILLNEFFLNPTATSTYGECIDWTYGYYGNTYKSKNCTDIKGYGIQSTELRNYIQPVTWYLYGYTSADLSKQNWYNCERNNYSGCASANSGTYSGTTTASIGLMYVSDYMYASGYIASNATTTGSSSNFINLNWLYKGFEWTLTPKRNSGTDAFDVGSTGDVNSNNSYRGSGLRPTFYLKSTIKIKSGDGTFKNPYTIG